VPKGYEEHNMLPKELRGGPATPRGQEYLGPTENEGRQRAVREYIERQLMQRGIDPNTPLDPAPQHMQQQPQRPQIRNDPPPGISGGRPPTQQVQQPAQQSQPPLQESTQPMQGPLPPQGAQPAPGPEAQMQPGIWDMLKQYLSQQQQGAQPPMGQMNQPMQRMQPAPRDPRAPDVDLPARVEPEV